MYLLPLVFATLLGGEPVIDDFRYVSAASARAEWPVAEGSPPVEVVDEDRPVMRLAAPFASQPKLPRVVADRRIKLDLVSTGGFLLEAAIDDPQSVGSLTLYFRSGKGWYASTLPAATKGRQTFRFSKASFQKEGNPAGWEKIDAIRLACWRARGADVRDSTVGFRRLTAVTQQTVLVLPAKKSFKTEREFRDVRATVETTIAMMEDLGVKADEIDEDSLSIKSLGDRRVAVLPHNPMLNNECAETLTKFVNAGGKVVVCYTLHPKLAAALGFGGMKWLGQQRPGQFAEMRFDDAAIAGLPKTVRQSSWNITTAEPAGHNARIIARWFDDAGKPTGYPAALVSDRGAFLSHVVLADDAAAKKQLLAALLGHFEPSLWKEIAQVELERARQIGHTTPGEEQTAFLTSNAVSDRYFDKGLDAGPRAGDQFRQGKYVETVELARTAHNAFVEAYLRAEGSTTREGRAMWNHSGTGAFPGDWQRSAKLLHENGFNMILPNMLWGGVAHYASDVLPRSATFRQYGDQIEQCCAAAKKHGLEVHVWKVNFNLGAAPKDFVETLHRDGRTQMTAKGEPMDWLCPSHPKNQALEKESLLEVARKYPVDGLHFDYIRYPNGDCCFCAGCRERFEADNGRKVADWPKECHSGPRKQEYNDWRCRQITSLVSAVSREARQIRPGLKISAAVFGAYPSCRESVAQDWPAWIKAGYLDFVCPMDYTARDAEFVSLVTSQMKLIEGRVPLYPGIGATATGMGLAPDRVVGQIHHARASGAAGFTIFNFEPGTAAAIVPGVGLGAGSQSAVPPHRNPK